MPESASILVSRAMISPTSLDVPQALRDSLKTHESHLIDRSAALLAGGPDEIAVAGVIEEAFSSDKEQLVKTIMALRENGNV